MGHPLFAGATAPIFDFVIRYPRKGAIFTRPASFQVCFDLSTLEPGQAALKPVVDLAAGFGPRDATEVVGREVNSALGLFTAFDLLPDNAPGIDKKLLVPHGSDTCRRTTDSNAYLAVVVDRQFGDRVLAQAEERPDHHPHVILNGACQRAVQQKAHLIALDLSLLRHLGSTVATLFVRNDTAARILGCNLDSADSAEGSCYHKLFPYEVPVIPNPDDHERSSGSRYPNVNGQWWFPFSQSEGSKVPVIPNSQGRILSNRREPCFQTSLALGRSEFAGEWPRHLARIVVSGTCCRGACMVESGTATDNVLRYAHRVVLQHSIASDIESLGFC